MHMHDSKQVLQLGPGTSWWRSWNRFSTCLTCRENCQTKAVWHSIPLEYKGDQHILFLPSEGACAKPHLFLSLGSSAKSLEIYLGQQIYQTSSYSAGLSDIIVLKKCSLQEHVGGWAPSLLGAKCKTQPWLRCLLFKLQTVSNNTNAFCFAGMQPSSTLPTKAGLI